MRIGGGVPERYGASFGVKKSSKIDRGDCCTTLDILQTTELDTFMSELYGVRFIVQ